VLGNEIEALEKYWNLTKLRGFDEDEFISYIDGCKDGECIKRRQVRDHENPHIWHRKNDYHDCDYTLFSFGNGTVETSVAQPMYGGGFQLTLQTLHCNAANIVELFRKQWGLSSGKGMNQLGGSTFDIFAETDWQLVRCEVTDHFDGNYSILCPTMSHQQQHQLQLQHQHEQGASSTSVNSSTNATLRDDLSSSLCMQVSLTGYLSYEYFDACAEVLVPNTDMTPTDRVELFYRKPVHVCPPEQSRNQPIPPSGSMSAPHYLSVDVNNQDSFWSLPPPISPSLVPYPLTLLQHTGVWIRTPNASSVDKYHWHWHRSNSSDEVQGDEDSTSKHYQAKPLHRHRVELRKETLIDFIEKNNLTLHLYGASHMRFNYDVLLTNVKGEFS
jgi:hypothetical protein